MTLFNEIDVINMEFLGNIFVLILTNAKLVTIMTLFIGFTPACRF